MENKQNNQDSESSSGSDEATQPEDADVLPPYKSLSSGKARKKIPIPFTAIIMLLVFVGGAAGGFFLHKKQERYRGEMLARMDLMDSKLSGMEADRNARKALRRELAVFQGDTAEALKKQKISVNNLKGELSRLRQAMQQQSAGQTFDGAETLEYSSIDAYEESDAEDEEIAEAPANQTRPKNRVKRSKETQKYIDLVESTFQKFIRLVSEGSVKIWDYFSDLIAKFSKS